jgi:3-oxoacyl-[acyl-carrier protein] reductase
VLLLVQAYVRLRAGLPSGTPGGRVVMMTSGQDLGDGMPGEIAYALQKGALASITRSLSTALAEHAVTVNTVNPGPVDTDYLTGDAYEAVAARFPSGRWGMPDDPARLVAWLATDEAAWITGQVIGSEGGFRR